MFALVLFYAAISMLRQSKKQDEPVKNSIDSQSNSASMPCQLAYEQGRLVWIWPCARALAFSGIATGFLSELLAGR